MNDVVENFERCGFAEVDASRDLALAKVEHEKWLWKAIEKEYGEMEKPSWERAEKNVSCQAAFIAHAKDLEDKVHALGLARVTRQCAWMNFAILTKSRNEGDSL